jgi:beta-glucosidase
MNNDVPSYRERHRPVDERVNDLLARMTRAEKLAQLGSLWGYEVADDTHADIARLRELAPGGVGQISRVSGSTNLRPADAARVTNEIQRFLVEHTRLGIPAIVHEECLHGVLAFDAFVYQQSIGAAATFDPQIIGGMAGTVRRRMLAIGARQALGPVLDITRDPRWGRVEETYGEDPYLATAMALAYIKGLQGEALTDGVAATAKHLVGHGMAEGGLNQGPVHIGPRELTDEQFVPFEAAVAEAGVASVMPAYCDVDGLPCHASHELLSTILRERWGFDGLVVSDYGGIEMLRSAHRLTDDRSVAARTALEAGVDVELPRVDVYGTGLHEALESGAVTDELLDLSVRRVLHLKFELGLFDAPYVDVPGDELISALAADEVAIGHALAVRSLVLVQNDGTLPLPPAARVAVIGGVAASPREFLGDYSHLLHLETLAASRRSGSTAFGIIDVGRDIAPEDELRNRATLIDEIRRRLGGERVEYFPGVGVHGGDDTDIEAAAAGAAEADVAIVVIGERSGLTDDSTTGEFRDRRDLTPSGRQHEMLEAVVATGTPVVLVVVSGRPLALEWAAANCAAILLAWVPGDLGPIAIAEVIAGVEEPGGRLPISMPRNVGQLPLNYRHHPTGGRSNPLGDYVDGPTTPLWPFGWGLGYSRCELSNLRMERDTLATDDDAIAVSVDVTNCGTYRTSEVVQLYVRDEEASVARPTIELRGFQRVTLEPAETCTVEFTVHSEQLAYTGADGRRVIEPGALTIFVGRSSQELNLQASISMVGPTVELPLRRRSVSASRVT